MFRSATAGADRMMHLLDGSEGRLGSGRHPEAVRLALPPGADRRVLTLVPIAAGSAGCLARGRVVRRRLLPRAVCPSVRRAEASRLGVWSRSAAAWALHAEPGVGLEATLLEGPARMTPSVRRWARRLALFRRVCVPDREDASAWVRAGLPGARVEVTEPDEGLVGENLAALAERYGLPLDRAVLRERLCAEPGELVVFPIASPWSSFDAQRLVLLLGMLRINGCPASAVVPASAWRLAGARVFREQARLGTRLWVIDGPMTPWLPACDAAYLDAERPRDSLLDFKPRGALRVLIAAARSAGVPVAVAPGSVLEARPRRAPSVASELRPLLDIIAARDSLV